MANNDLLEGQGYRGCTGAAGAVRAAGWQDVCASEAQKLRINMLEKGNKLSVLIPLDTLTTADSLYIQKSEILDR